MHVFGYRFLADAIPADIVGASNIIYDLRGRDAVRRETNVAVFEGLREAAMIDSVRGSNAIEGIVTTQARMQELLQMDAPPSSHAEREIVGYRDALQEIYAPGFASDLSENMVCHFHQLLFRTSSKSAGSYKTEDNWRQERDATGHLSVRFAPVRAKDTPDVMSQWAMAYREARQDSRISNLLLIPCVVVDFLCIHPFADGNGRVSRLLTTALLQRCGFDVGRFVSIEAMIDEHKAGYYDALAAASSGWHDNRSDYTPFIAYLQQIICACYKELDTRFVAGGAARVPKSQQVEALVMAAFVPISKREIAQRLPDVSVTTIERVLGRLVKEGRVERIGSYRDARYRCA